MKQQDGRQGVAGTATPADRWELAKQHFGAVVEHDPEERDRLLRELCAGDGSLQEEVESLLRSHDRSAGFLLDSAAGSVLPDTSGWQTGSAVGPYRILRQIGEGGMGTVYLAVRADDHYTTTVAIKIMSRAMSGEVLRRRFLNERQILAGLNHPNIARLFDGGTANDGSPYIVMEYVEGEPIDAYCRSRQLPIAERLKLFRSVCSAVQYAHAQLVVHRDLKPENILIDGHGEPKLLDFGIAKLLDTSDTAGLKTATEFRQMTPAYASPEQVAGLPISTASDIYSLGVVLYELLAGKRPYELVRGDATEVVRLVCNVDPPRPSTVARQSGSPDVQRHHRDLQGDLDRIVMKALRKDPRERYGSVEQLSEDLQRHLDGRPVLAREPTIGYRTSKFLRRNAGAVSAAILVLGVLLGSTIYSFQQAAIAEKERRHAEEQAAIASKRFNEVRALANTMLFEVHDALQPLPGSLAVRQLITRRGLQYLDGLAGGHNDDPEVMSELAMAYDKLGGITFEVDGAMQSHRKAVVIHERLVREHPTVSRHQERLAISLGLLANLLKLDGDHAGELAAYQRATGIVLGLRAAAPANRHYLELLKELYDATGGAEAALHRLAGGIRSRRKGLDLARLLTTSDPQDADHRRGLVISLHLLSTTLIADGQFDEARRNYEEALSIMQPMATSHPANNNYRRDLWYVHRGLGITLSSQGRHKEGIAHILVSLDLKKHLVANDPADAGHRRGLAVTYLSLGDAHLRHGLPLEARRSFERAITLSEQLLRDDPRNQETWDDLREEYARLRIVAGVTGERDVSLRERQLYEEVLSADPGNPKALRAIGGPSDVGS